MLLTVRTGVIAVTTGFTALSLACGGGGSLDKVDEDDWVADVCDEAGHFDDDVHDAGNRLQVALGYGDLDDIKEGFEEYQAGYNRALDNFVEEIEEAGQPDIHGGADVIKAIRARAKAKKDNLRDVRERVDDIDQGEDDFYDELARIFNDDGDDPDLRTRFEDIDESDVDDLIHQIDAEPGCGLVMFGF